MASAYDDEGPINRMLLAAHQQPDVCGLKIEAVHLAWTGGATYLHLPVPIYPHFGAPRESGFFNYVVTLQGAVSPQQVVAADGNVVLARIANGCRPDVGYSWRLP